MVTDFQIRQLEERIADYERAVHRFDGIDGSSDPMVTEFRERLESMRAELRRLTEALGVN